MKKHTVKKDANLTAKVLAGALAAFLLFGSVAGVLMYILL